MLLSRLSGPSPQNEANVCLPTPPSQEISREKISHKRFFVEKRNESRKKIPSL